jgi:peroxiredoxin
MSSTARRKPRTPSAPRRGARSARAARPPSRRPGPSRTGTARPRAGQPHRSRYRAALAWPAGLIVLAGLITTALLSARSGSTQASVTRPAPGFTLTSTAGTSVSLASYRGRDVVLYFNEGVGCDACFYQMREFEQHARTLASAGITIVPIVMNPAIQVRPELAAFGIRTPYLIDAAGTVARAYGVFGKGMHAGLPGHSFVLIDARGTERWYGEYPSMYLSTAGLISQVKAHLPG